MVSVYSEYTICDPCLARSIYIQGKDRMPYIKSTYGSW